MKGWGAVVDDRSRRHGRSVVQILPGPIDLKPGPIDFKDPHTWRRWRGDVQQREEMESEGSTQ